MLKVKIMLSEDVTRILQFFTVETVNIDILPRHEVIYIYVNNENEGYLPQWMVEFEIETSNTVSLESTFSPRARLSGNTSLVSPSRRVSLTLVVSFARRFINMLISIIYVHEYESQRCKVC